MSNKQLKFQPVIGLEIHVELKTKAKMFCRCSADHFHTPPNTNICPVCLGLPGAMPYPNLKALEKTLLIAHLLHCRINRISRFERKHYFYPDLPKGYQLTQYLYPMGYQGYLEVEGKRFFIRRVHQEEDTAKLKHQRLKSRLVSLVDFNRSGVPLVEMVTEPVFDNSQDVVAFLKKLQRLLRFYEVSSCDMEKGSMRLEANISLRPEGSKELPDYKVELKNINSFRFLAEAIDYEIKRQTQLLSQGKEVTQETRGYNSVKKFTFSQRVKEEAQDYHYLLEPDIPPVYLSDEVVEKVRKTPDYSQLIGKWIKLGWPKTVVNNLLIRQGQLEWWQELETTVQKEGLDRHKLGHFLLKNKGSYYLKDISKLIARFKEDEKIINNVDQLVKVVKEVVANNPKAVADYQKGKESAIYFLLGQVRYRLGKVNVQITLQQLRDVLTDEKSKK